MIRIDPTMAALVASELRIIELQRQVEVLEWALAASGTIAAAGLGVAAAVAAERPSYCPEANPLNAEPAS